MLFFSCAIIPENKQANKKFYARKKFIDIPRILEAHGNVRNPDLRTSLAVQWLWFWASTEEGMVSIPGQRTKIPHALWRSQKEKKSLIWKEGSTRRAPLQWCVRVRAVAQFRLTLCNPKDYSLRGSSAHGILQERILEWVAIPFSRGSSWPRDWTHISCVFRIGRRILYCCTPWGTPSPSGGGDIFLGPILSW